MYSAMYVFPVPLSPCKTIGVAAGANTWDLRRTSAMAGVSATGSSADEGVGASAARSACVARMVAGIRLKVEHGGRARHCRNTRAATKRRTHCWHALRGRDIVLDSVPSTEATRWHALLHPLAPLSSGSSQGAPDNGADHEHNDRQGRRPKT